MDRHGVGSVKRFVAVWAFSHAVGDATIDALVAKHVSAGLKYRVLDVVLTHRTHDQFLQVG